MDALLLLNDSDGLKREELAILAGHKSISADKANPDLWQNFYERLKEIKDYHKKH